MTLIELHVKNTSGRVKVIAIPLDKIQSIETYIGSENCYAKVNGIEVEETYNEICDLISQKILVIQKYRLV